MPRKKLIRSDVHPYHVTARGDNREAFPVDLALAWQIFSLECLVLTQVYEAQIQSFVLMPNHCHMILTTPSFDLGEVMNAFISSVTRTLNFVSGRTGHVFGGPYFWSIIENSRYYGHALKYVYRNPVKAGLCQKVEDYPFSTLNGLLGRSHLPFPVFSPRLPLDISLPTAEPGEQLPWLNTPFPSEAEAVIQRGLRRRNFSVIMDRRTRAPHALLAQLI